MESENLTAEQRAHREALRSKVDGLRQSITMKAETIVHEIMPGKITQLDELIMSDLFRMTDLSLVESALGVPVPSLPPGGALSSKSLSIANAAAKTLASHLSSTGTLLASTSSASPLESSSLAPKKRRIDEVEGAAEQAQSGKRLELESDSNGNSSAASSSLPLSDSHNGSAKYDHHYLVPSNKLIQQILEMLKKEIEELITICNIVKMWIQLNIPRIEGGNNLGVSIQEETVAELSRSEDSGFALLESMTKYYQTRAKLVSKVLKYPNIEDYHRSVIEFDQKQYTTLRVCVLDLRNSYAILYDLIIKNLDNIKKPRSEHAANLY